MTRHYIAAKHMVGIDDVFKTVGDRRRRELLFAVRETKGGGIEAVSVPEDVVEGEAVRDQVAIEYQQIHLPKLEDHGFIQWDRRRDEVVAGPRFDRLEPLLEVVEEHWGEEEVEAASNGG